VKVQYSIRDIEKLTGIKAHTLRIWEQRYNFVTPHRTDTNIRYYDDEQLKFLLNVGVLIKHGRKISKVAQMNPDNVAKELLKISGETSDKNTYFDVQIDNLLIAMIDLDEDKFEKVISTCTLRYGFEQTMVHLITPFLGKVGVLWSVGEINISQEHFISNLIRRKLIVAIDGFSGKGKREEKFLLYLPEGEYHELGLLFAKYLIKSKGFQVIYLGQSLPFDDLKNLSHKYQPNYILTYFTAGLGKMGLRTYLENMTREVYASNEYIICGPKAKEAAAGGKLPEKMRFVETVKELQDFLVQLENHV
jgi:DNA-binding transcriptional MerR regulator